MTGSKTVPDFLQIAATVTATPGSALTPGYHYPIDATAGDISVTLPNAAAGDGPISFERLDNPQVTGHTVTINGHIRGASAQSRRLTTYREYVQYTPDQASVTWWPSGNPNYGWELAIQRALHMSSTRVEAGPRLERANTTCTPANQQVVLSYIDQPWDADAAKSTFQLIQAGNGAAGGVTLARALLYSRDASDNLSLLAFSADFSAAINGATAPFVHNLAFSTGTVNGVTGAASYAPARGEKLAIGLLLVGTSPTFKGLTALANISTLLSTTPKLAVVKTNVTTDAPASMTAASLTANSPTHVAYVALV